ncbi:MAG: nickel pincer cofactor biosynthesis protein LarB [Candidatus Bipolaricaulota bacterium]
MDKEKLKDLLEEFKHGDKSTEEVMGKLEELPFKDIGYAKIDTHRDLRRGAPEAIYCEGKTEDQVLEILDEMYPEDEVIATRVDGGTLEVIDEKYEEAHVYPDARVAFVGSYPKETLGKISVITAGTTDIPVAKKSEVTARSMGVKVDPIYDVGVSGLHRVISYRERIDGADMAVVVAGMEGALPSVVSGLVSTPIVAVPTKVGYGANLDGISPLLTMLNTCSPGVTVVNIGDGYGAGYFAASTIRGIKGGDDPTP